MEDQLTVTGNEGYCVARYYFISFLPFWHHLVTFMVQSDSRRDEGHLVLWGAFPEATTRLAYSNWVESETLWVSMFFFFENSKFCVSERILFLGTSAIFFLEIFLFTVWKLQFSAPVQACVGYTQFSYGWRSLKGTKFHDSYGAKYFPGGFKVFSFRLFRWKYANFGNIGRRRAWLFDSLALEPISTRSFSKLYSALFEGKNYSFV